MTPERWQHVWDVHEAVKWALTLWRNPPHDPRAHPANREWEVCAAICERCARDVLAEERRLLDAALHPGEPVLAAEHEQGHR